jgi:uncharacterized protein
MTLTLPRLEPLTADEVSELTQHLTDSGSASLDYARGVFTAVACGPSPVEPTTWLPWVLGSAVPSKASLRQVLELLVRDAQSISECLELGEPWLPESVEALVQFSKGFTRGTQSNPAWQQASEVFTKLLPIAVRAEYIDLAAIERFVPESAANAQAWIAAEHEQLPIRLLEIYHHFAKARAERKPARSEKVGRNEPCPCGSGKKHKKCCAH